MIRRLLPIPLLRLLPLLLVACRPPADPPGPIVVIGIDGADRKVLERLWSEERLPHLRALAERGVFATLETFTSQSPVIWTTIATGVEPEVHGIIDFVVPTPDGDVPVSSVLRKVPAIWNMLTASDRRIAVLGWWPTWPVEPINGLMVSERVLLDLEERVYPPELLSRIDDLADETASPEGGFADDLQGHRDRLLARLAPQLAEEDWDLLLVYFKSVDWASHRFWKHYFPGRIGVDPEELEAYRDRLPSAYEAIDAAVGRIVEAAGPETNFFVVSDHGFYGRRREKAHVPLDLDAVLEKLGYLTFSESGGVDLSRSAVFTYATPRGRSPKRVRFALAGREPAGRVRAEERQAIRRRLERDLSRVLYASGEPALRLRDNSRRAERGGDFAVEVLKRSPTRCLLFEGEPILDAVGEIATFSGSHNAQTHGVLIAAGPDIVSGVQPEAMRVHDITPTLLFGLGLPVARDFAGIAHGELFTQAFRRSHPARTIASWGSRRAGEALTSEADEELIEELRALGYLD